MKEPARICDIELLDMEFRRRLERVLRLMKEWGYEPWVYETFRTQERQNWLYGIGRTHKLKRKPVTWTLHSRHKERRAADVISRKGKWDDRQFFANLELAAQKNGLETLKSECCHVQM